jgi:hypothetical protein
MRRLNVSALSMSLLAACAADSGSRQACWEAAPTEDVPLTATVAETLGERELRRTRAEYVAATQQVELADCPRPPLTSPDGRPLDDRERTGRKLEPLIKK